jgi:2-desacetyl-2-hydroxyethyl bacteriochlorophyllide A dehydrogenase
MMGEVLEAPADSPFMPGTRVVLRGNGRADLNLMWGGHCSQALRLPQDLQVVPDGVRDEDAVLAGLAAISYHAVKAANLERGQRIVVVGLGIIGQFVARFAAQAGTEVLALDLSPTRVEIANQAVKAKIATQPLATGVKEVFPMGGDVVFDVTGVPGLFGQMMDTLRTIPWDDEPYVGPKVVVTGSYPSDLCLNYQEAFLRQLTILFPRDRQNRDVKDVLNLLAKGKVSFEGILTGIANPDDCQTIYHNLLDDKENSLTYAFRWSG